MAFTAPTTRATDFLVTAAIWNAEHVDNFNTGVMHLIARKTADESVTSSTALQDDDHLVLNLAANEVWEFRYNLRYEGGTQNASDLKISWGLPASGRVNAHAAAINSAGSPLVFTWDITTTDGSPSSFGTNGAGVARGATIEGQFINGGTAGNYTLRWAQLTSNGTPTKILANSTLWGVKLA
jgi:hypothetical protein